MYDLRNCVEHEFWTISLVNYDQKSKKAGLAINVDNSLLNLNLKNRLKARLRDWAIECGNRGETAWLSLGGCTIDYSEIIHALYCMLLSFLLEEAARSINDRGRVLESLEGCMIIWDGLGVEKYSASCQARASYSKRWLDQSN